MTEPGAFPFAPNVQPHVDLDMELRAESDAKSGAEANAESNAAPNVGPNAEPIAELMALPASRAVRMVALAKLDDIASGYEQLRGGDAEGLHDLRVALRRLRTWLRAYAPLVDGALKKKTRRRLKALARATSQARDAEVAAEWVESEPEPPQAARAGFRDAAKRLGHERDAGLRSVRATVERDLPSLVTRLKHQLAIPSDPAPGTLVVPEQSMQEAAHFVIERHKARLARALEVVRSHGDVEEAHRARIAAKRLRYVLEPMYEGAHAKAVVAPLVSLQDALGAARDAHQLAMRFVREVGEWAARDARQQALQVIGIDVDDKAHPSFARVRAGLVELARRSHEREDGEFQRFWTEWGPDVATAKLDRIP